MQKHIIKQWPLEKLILKENKLLIYRLIPDQVEIIEKRFPGDDREIKVLKYKDELYLELDIDINQYENLYLVKDKFEIAKIELQYQLINSKHILISFSIFDISDFDNLC